MPNYMEWGDYQTKIEFLDGGEGYDILYFGGGSGFKNYGTEELENVAVNFEEYRFSSDGGTVTLGNQIASSGETIVIDANTHNPYSLTFTYLGEANITYKGSDRDNSGTDMSLIHISEPTRLLSI